jgi:pullulanase/glycogen debranching enzyme
MEKSQAASVTSSVYSIDEVESFQNDQSQDSTAESTETTSESLDRHKSVSSDDLSISDTDDDSVTFYPDEYDIAFDTPGHAGTVVYEMAVRQAVSSHDGAPFSTRIFKEIEKQVDGKNYYLKEVTGRFEFWREATPEEARQHFRKSYKRELAAIE